MKVGKPTPLIGVTTEPEAFRPERPAVLILNSGIMHHVGTCRLSVRLARAVASKGLLAVRYDASGIGDSAPRRGAGAFEQVSVAECREVMDYLERTRGIRQFVLYGLCSGADASYHTALADPRVVGISQFDPYCYETWRFYVEYYWPILFHGTRWKSFLTNRWKRLTGRIEAAHPAAAADEQFVEIPTYTRIFPPRDDVAEGLKRLMERGVHLQVNFPRGPLYNHRRQFRDSFRDVVFGDHLQVNYYPAANHIVTQPGVQRVVIHDIAEWMSGVAARVAMAAAPKPDAV